MHVWLQAIFLVTSSKKGISSNQLARVLDITIKSAWFLSHRIREAMKDGSIGTLGGGGKIVEADETYHGKKSGKPPTHNALGVPYPKGKGGAKTRFSLKGIIYNTSFFFWVRQIQ